MSALNGGENKYPNSDAQFAGLNIARNEFHGDWNCNISPP